MMNLLKSTHTTPPAPRAPSRYRELLRQAREAELELNRLCALQADLAAEHAVLEQQRADFVAAQESALDAAIEGRPVQLTPFDSRRHGEVEALLSRLPGHIQGAETKLHSRTRESSQVWQSQASQVALRLAGELMADSDTAAKLRGIVASGILLDDVLATSDKDKIIGRKYLEDFV